MPSGATSRKAVLALPACPLAQSDRGLTRHDAGARLPTYGAPAMSKLPLLCPPRMSAGAQVGVVSPSSPSAGRFPRRFQRGLDGVEALGWRLKIGESALAVTGHTAGDPDERAADINQMIADPDVTMILATIGGTTRTTSLMPLISKACDARPRSYSAIATSAPCSWLPIRRVGSSASLVQLSCPSSGRKVG